MYVDSKVSGELQDHWYSVCLFVFFSGANLGRDLLYPSARMVQSISKRTDTGFTS